MPVEITRDNISWNGKGEVFVRDSRTAQEVSNDKSAVAELLSTEVKPLSADEIHVDQHGMVVIKNHDFQKEMERRALRPQDIAGLNIGCGLGC